MEGRDLLEEKVMESLVNIAYYPNRWRT